MSLILIIDDDRQLCSSFSKILIQEGYTTEVALSGKEGIATAQASQPDVAVLDVRLPDMTGLEVFDILHQQFPKLPVLIVTAFESTETAIEVIRKGAYDFIYKPFDVLDMLQLIEKAVFTGRCMSSPVDVNPQKMDFSSRDALVGNCRQMLEVYKGIGRVASTDATVLIRGESGTGKELATRAIYNYSNRADKPFMVVNCVAIPETLLESELFGYEKGSFTGAAHRRLGKIEQAQGGTVFLDEVGDMPLSIQAKLLRLLQEKSIERLGGKEPVDVDVRIIAATNKNLEAAVKNGSFREDLYYRLRVVTITMPPLRERKDDIATLVNYLLLRLSHKMSGASPGITDEAMVKLQQYDWPGNIRELSNTLKKTLIFNRGAPIAPEDISFPHLVEESDTRKKVGTEQVRQWVRAVLTNGEQEKAYEFCLQQVATLLIKEALELTANNKSQAAKVLGITRPTLHAKMEKYCIGEQGFRKD
ncbi:sigma-54 dependent transcriptional regulator [Desulfogranum marinum]|uniref:sigma-54-dependent transcriptional regulator n=1 Tax=Desulfogranum marinum TaxID=453220 RepID=UPI00196323D0|nr:sigma-54 dependent transcriptional regulator [Desulfogranum marinum]MBM9510929.1 sigma-54-dependent Fis family transcriptional regulator [Desulfogranum marinum]